MRVLVLGGGIIGSTTAFYLAQAGVQVDVLERQASTGLETSFANGGQISPGYSSPWAAPGVPVKVIKWLLGKHSPVGFRFDGTHFQHWWLRQVLKNCTHEAYQVNKSRMVRLAEYSRDCFKALRASLGISYDDRQLGTLQVFRTQAQIDAAHKDMMVLDQLNVPYQLLDATGCLKIEPALAHAQTSLTGGLYLPNDETGDCHLFTQKITRAAQDLGAKFHYQQSIEEIQTNHQKIISVKTSQGAFQADAYVFALGSYSTSLAKQLGLALPVYPVKGYSITLPLIAPLHAPNSTVTDETHKVVLTRFSDRLRVAGMAEVAGFDLRLKARRRATLEKVVRDLFPLAGDLNQLEFWTGLRPMTPDGTPVLGRCAIENLFLNTGHGTLGWTMSCGSAAFLRDVLLNKTPEINPEGLDLTRYTKA